MGVEEGANRIAGVGLQCRVTAARAFSVTFGLKQLRNGGSRMAATLLRSLDTMSAPPGCENTSISALRYRLKPLCLNNNYP